MVESAGTLAVGQALWSASFDVQHSMPAGVLRLTQFSHGAYKAHTAQAHVQLSWRRRTSFLGTAPKTGAAVICGCTSRAANLGYA